MNLKVLGLSERIQLVESLARFGEPLTKVDFDFLAGNGLQDAEHRAANCLGWIWRHWLIGTPKDVLSRRVEPFVERGLEWRKRSQSYDYLPRHDLFLLHCAIFASSDSFLRAVAEQIADASGDKGAKPMDYGYGELYEAAWCGMMKYWILGDEEKAIEQSNFVWGAYRDKQVSAAPKPLVAPWLRRDWTAFVKAQQKDFEKLWNRARRDGATVKREDSNQTIVTTDGYQIRHQWCWAHCGMAVLAHRQGAAVATDPFWFPATALTDTSDQNARKQKVDNAQQLLL